jgi:hypothetical protein
MKIRFAKESAGTIGGQNLRLSIIKFLKRSMNFKGIVEPIHENQQVVHKIIRQSNEDRP